MISRKLTRISLDATVGNLNTMRKTYRRSLAAIAIASLCWGSAAKSIAQSEVAQSEVAQSAPQAIDDPVIEVGVVQRFGSEAGHTLTIQPPSGQSMTLKFDTNGREQTITTANPIEFEIGMMALPQPQQVERVVLSSHRSFESAEYSANRWRAKGVEVEIAQPRGWQVWAKRDTYSTPLLRRLLLQNLQANGSRTAIIDSQTQTAIPKSAFVLNGFRYQRDRVEITIPGQRLFVTRDQERNRRLYAGSLRLQPNAYGTYTLVNPVPIEAYLRGVVPHEIGTGAPQPAIEAQAVLARTYALRNLRRFAIDGYELCADTQCQVYQGVGGAAPNTDRAIVSTRGLVLTYNNELVDALYSSTTGGVTAPFNDVWNGSDRPYLQAVVDSPQPIWDLSRLPLSDENNFRQFIARSPQSFNENGWAQFRWRRETTLTEIAAGLKQYLQNTQQPLANLTQVRELQILERSPAGRVQRIAISTDVGTVELQKDEILRALFPPTSTLFYLDPIYEPLPAGTPAPAPNAPPPQRTLKGYAFVGGGLGHGVGMSQAGSYNLGDLGWTSPQILNFYYPGTQLQRLNTAIVFWPEGESQSIN